MRMKSLALGLIGLMLAGPVQAGGPVDPDWPCIQRRQPALSLAQVWSGPLPGAQGDAPAEAGAGATGPALLALSQQLALRRTSLEQAEELVGGFAASAGPEELTALFVATFENIQSQRNRVMAGITRYAHKQEALDAQIVELRHGFASASAAADPDFDQLDRMEADLDWMTRIFQDRQQSLTYVCETPVILEQRAFAIGRIIAARL